MSTQPRTEAETEVLRLTSMEIDGSEEADLSVAGLLAANAELRARLEETEETLAAIQRGDVDGLVVGDSIYILDSANAANNKLRNDVLAQMEDAVLAFDANGRVIFMNVAAERQYQRTSSSVLGRPKQDLYREEWPEESERLAAESALQNSGMCRAHSIHVCSDGLAIHVESTLSRLRDANGNSVGYLSVIRDITARVRVEETLHAATLALQDADRRKDEFLATLAHELRNPLAPIRNALQIMKLSSDPSVHQSARDIIQRQLGQMVHLVDDLLDVSRISQGKVELRREAVDVVSAVQTAIETSRPAIDAAKHRLNVTLPPLGTLIADADFTRLCQIVANLLNNAAKYTNDGGTIDVTAENENGEAVIKIRDSGIGITPEMLPRIFEMFAQVDRSLEHSKGGLGIGLALVRRLIEMHGGSVNAHSDGPGRGSTFTIRIPTIGSMNATKEPKSSRDLRSEVGSGFRVLVVDDNIDSAESLSRILEMLGYEIRTQNDGLGAVIEAATFAPRAILLDIGLPKLNGYEAAKRIRAEANGRDLLLVALSGWGQDEDRRKSKEAGFDYHFVKPVDIDMLTDLLSRVDSPRTLST
jgi:PAS domain S-box-containing protein